jgi:hypothetical protein
MDVGRLRNGCLGFLWVFNVREACSTGLGRHFLFLCALFWAGAGFLGAEVVVGGSAVYIRCGSVWLRGSALTGLPGADTINLRVAS